MNSLTKKNPFEKNYKEFKVFLLNQHVMNNDMNLKNDYTCKNLNEDICDLLKENDKCMNEKSLFGMVIFIYFPNFFI